MKTHFPFLSKNTEINVFNMRGCLFVDHVIFHDIWMLYQTFIRCSEDFLWCFLLKLLLLVAHHVNANDFQVYIFLDIVACVQAGI